MEYHQDSFLAGIAVGRRLKGWACGGNFTMNMGDTGNSGGVMSLIWAESSAYQGMANQVLTVPALICGDYEEE